jgi:hypothetical protein
VQQLYAQGAATVAHSNTTALSSGLVGYWSFDGGTLNWNTGTVQDVSGNGNTGQLISMSTTTSVVAGKIGSALNFNGSTSYVNAGTNSVLGPTNNLSISAWVKLSSGAATGVISKQRGSRARRICILRVCTHQRVELLN